MFGIAEYNEYSRLMDLADRAYKQDNMLEYEHYNDKANAAYENFEYASGIKSDDY